MLQSGVYANLAFSLLLLWSASSPRSSRGTASSQPALEGEVRPCVTVLFDNNLFDTRLKAQWGFSCLVEGWERTVLFDTGGEGATLLHNMSRLGVQPAVTDVIFLSHIHGDHTGGIGRLLEEKGNVDVYLPKSFFNAFKDTLKLRGAHVKEVSRAEEIFTDVYTTGELGNGLMEQSLVLKTSKGLVVITGCAHPGIVNIVRKAKEITGADKVYLVMGGFHLAGETPSQIRSIVAEFHRLSVLKVAPCHCSGDGARSLFRQAYGEGYIECGVGTRINLP